MSDTSAIVIGGGIAGLTTAALLASENIPVTLFEAHYQLGGCAGTFHRGPFVFDAGATQVAGLENGGIHNRLFNHLKLPQIQAEILDPACVVDLLDGSPPIHLWHDPEKWKNERKNQFPNSEGFWDICEALHKSNWSLVARDPVVPSRSFWDYFQLLKSLRLGTLSSAIFTTFTISDLLRLTNCHQDKRLRDFLDLQLRLFSQEPSDRTSALYGATVLKIFQAPLGLWHLQGSMQKLSDSLAYSLQKNGGKLFLNHRVVKIIPGNSERSWKVILINKKGKLITKTCRDIICSLPPQSLFNLIPYEAQLKHKYFSNLNNLPKPTGALVFYGAIQRELLSKDFANHIQIKSKSLGSIFLSISKDGDGRAPIGQATIIASAFTETSSWININDDLYNKQKENIFYEITEIINSYLGLKLNSWIHKELATPKSFLKWTSRPNGIVGGLGQHPYTSGLFGLPSRTPLQGLWLCGDSIHPGEGTAGVSQSALMVCRQVMASRGQHMNLVR